MLLLHEWAERLKERIVGQQEKLTSHLSSVGFEFQKRIQSVWIKSCMDRIEFYMYSGKRRNFQKKKVG